MIMNTFRKGLDLLLGSVCCLMLAIMVGIACWQVISRYILMYLVPYRRNAAILTGMGIYARNGFRCWEKTAY